MRQDDSSAMPDAAAWTMGWGIVGERAPPSIDFEPS